MATEAAAREAARRDATVQTTLHADTQIALEALLAAALDRYAGTINGAMLVIEAETGAVRARLALQAT